MSWNPSDEEVFVIRSRWAPDVRAVLLLPGGAPNPPMVEIDGVSYEYDEDMTEQTRMHVRVSNRKRGLAD